MPPLMPKPRYGSQSGDAYVPLVDQNPELDTAFYPPKQVYDVEGMQPPLYGHPLPSNDGMVNKPLMSGDQDRVYDLRAGGGRTPSPTPSEVLALNGKKPPLPLKRKIIRITVIILIVAISVVFSIYHTKIITALYPGMKKIHDLPAGFLIPIALIFILSFPPLFGAEIVHLLCGIAWGLGPGFAIVVVGTLLGEIGNYFIFKWCCTKQSRKLGKNIDYACLTRILRDGGFKVALAARYSIIPSHVTTAIFSCSGLGFMAFIPAVVLSLPTQLANVWLGTYFEDVATGEASKAMKIGSILITVITTIITFAAYKYIKWEMNKVKPQIIYERRKARGIDNFKFASQEQ